MLRWERIPIKAGGRDTGYANYLLHDEKGYAHICVRWCRHPTALRKYWVQCPAGNGLSLYDTGGFTTFRTVVQAKAAAERHYAYLQERDAA